MKSISLFQLLCVALLAITLASCSGTPIRDSVRNGATKQVFEWGFWNGRCQPAEFTIKVSKGPQSGTVNIGTGTMIIGRNSSSGARMACEGKKVATKVVNYTAKEGFKGTDTFRLSVFSRNTPPKLFDMRVKVF